MHTSIAIARLWKKGPARSRDLADLDTKRDFFLEVRAGNAIISVYLLVFGFFEGKGGISTAKIVRKIFMGMGLRRETGIFF